MGNSCGTSKYKKHEKVVLEILKWKTQADISQPSQKLTQVEGDDNWNIEWKQQQGTCYIW